MGEASIREIAEHLGRSPESVHYHVRSLLKANLIKAAFKRQVARKPETVYTSVSESYILPNPSEQPELALLIRKSITAGLRQVIRGYEEASRHAEKDPSAREHIHVIRVVFRLSPEDAKEVARRIDELSNFIAERRQEDGVQLHWSSIVYPDVK